MHDPSFLVILVAFTQQSYSFNEEDGTGAIELVKSGTVLTEPFRIRVFGGKKLVNDS